MKRLLMIEDFIEEIVNLYRQLNPFFKGYFKRQLLEIINYENNNESAPHTQAARPPQKPGEPKKSPGRRRRNDGYRQ